MKHTFIHVCIQTHSYAYIHTLTRACMDTHMQAHSYAYTLVHARTCVSTHSYTRTHVHKHTRIHTRTHTHTHTADPDFRRGQLLLLTSQLLFLLPHHHSLSRSPPLKGCAVSDSAPRVPKSHTAPIPGPAPSRCSTNICEQKWEPHERRPHPGPPCLQPGLLW